MKYLILLLFLSVNIFAASPVYDALLLRSATNASANVTLTGSGGVLLVNGTAAGGGGTSSLTLGHIFVGNGSNLPTDTTPANFTLNTSGTITIQASAITSGVSTADVTFNSISGDGIGVTYNNNLHFDTTEISTITDIYLRPLIIGGYTGAGFVSSDGASAYFDNSGFHGISLTLNGTSATRISGTSGILVATDFSQSGTQTLTNKSIDGANNTMTNIPAVRLSRSSRIFSNDVSSTIWQPFTGNDKVASNDGLTYLDNSGFHGALAGLTGTLSVSNGGTGVSSLTAYGLILGGTGSTSPVQILGTGTSGQLLTSNGAGVLPSWQAAPTFSFTSGTNTYILTGTFASPTMTGTETRAPTQAGVSTITGTTTYTAPILGTTGSNSGAWTFGATTVNESVGSSGLTLSGATQTSSFPVINATQTWNNSGTAFYGEKLNVTRTAAAAGSRLLSLQVGGSEYFAFYGDSTYNGMMECGAYALFNPSLGSVLPTNGMGYLNGGATPVVLRGSGVNIMSFGISSSLPYITMPSTAGFQWSASSTIDLSTTSDLVLSRSGSGVMNLGTAISNALGSLKLYGLTATGTSTLTGGAIIGSGGSAILKVVTATATLDFPSTAAGTSSDLNIALSAANVGDIVFVGVPGTSGTIPNTAFSGYVIATGTVAVRLSNDNLVNAVDPASATYRADVFQH